MPRAQSGIGWILRGSAICTDSAWVPCPGCARPTDDHNIGPFEYDVLEELWETERVSVASEPSSSASESNLYFALKNICGDSGDDDDEGLGLYRAGLVSFIGMIFLSFALIILGEHQKRSEVRADERNATCTDFSLEIINPPGDAVSADEWKAYLENVARVYLSKKKREQAEKEGGDLMIKCRDSHVTCVTVAINNGVLTDALAKCRLLKKKIKQALMNDDDDDEEDRFKEIYERAMDSGALPSDLPKKLAENLEGLLKIEAMIRDDLLKRKYRAVRIFATFETEVGQRAALLALSTGRIFKKKGALGDPRYAFRGFHVLGVKEPPEPQTIRWSDLSLSQTKKRVFTFFITIAIILGCYYLVKSVWRLGVWSTASVIALLNFFMPFIFRALVKQEAHCYEGTRQRSLFSKTLAFKYVNTAVVIHLITPFPWSLTPGNHLISGVCAIFVAEMWTSPIMQLLNIPGNVKRHLIGPREKTQEDMNLMFNGSVVELAERYAVSLGSLSLTSGGGGGDRETPRRPTPPAR